MGTDALLRLAARHLSSYMSLGSAAAAEFRSALVRRLALFILAGLAGTVGLAALWTGGLVLLWTTQWRMLYVGISGVVLVAFSVWALSRALGARPPGHSSGILRSELNKDMELFNQWKSTL